MDIHLQGEKLEQEECYRYLRTDMHESERLGEKIGYTARRGEKVKGVLRAIWKNKGMLVEDMKGMYEAVVVPTLVWEQDMGDEYNGRK